MLKQADFFSLNYFNHGSDHPETAENFLDFITSWNFLHLENVNGFISLAFVSLIVLVYLTGVVRLIKKPFFSFKGLPIKEEDEDFLAELGRFDNLDDFIKDSFKDADDDDAWKVTKKAAEYSSPWDLDMEDEELDLEYFELIKSIWSSRCE